MPDVFHLSSTAKAPSRFSRWQGLLLISALVFFSGCDPSPRAQQTAPSPPAGPENEVSQPTVDQKKQKREEFETSLKDVDPRLAEAIRKGATMEEIAKLKEPVATNSKDALRELKVGNARFFGGTSRRPGLDVNQRRAQVLSQTPFAVVLGCSDSRVPIELVYDQGLGDLFVVRVAGNLADPATVGSIEYGVQHLKSYIVVVMGHEGCGAIAAALLPEADQQKEPANIRHLLGLIRPALTNLPDIQDPQSRKREAVVRNILYQKEQLKKNPVVAAAIKSGKITVVGAYYNISSGIVDFYEEEGRSVSAVFQNQPHGPARPLR